MVARERARGTCAEQEKDVRSIESVDHEPRFRDLVAAIEYAAAEAQCQELESTAEVLELAVQTLLGEGRAFCQQELLKLPQLPEPAKRH